MRIYAKGTPQSNEMNTWESGWAQHLELEKRAGRISWWAFEAIKLWLAPKTSYTPDFFVMRSDGTLECHEVKGFWREDARVKVKVAAEKFPFKFIAITKEKGAWKEEVF